MNSTGWSVLWFTALALASPEDDSITAQRRLMVSEQIEARGIKDSRVLTALRTVPRHLFVPAAERKSAYEDRPLPIGWGQTISQPFIVAVMTELARPGPQDRVLEVGTGSGYQAAVLSGLVKEVYTIEILEPLGKEAARRLADLGYENVRARVGDGYEGWPEAAPFDIILVTAAPEQVPPPLIAQLKKGGRMVIPVGPVGEVQSLQLIEKDAAGTLRKRDLIPVQFVPLTGGPR
jgi:protein-L-isoaspartate(D-aspartate) O-methyltransferase